MGRRRRNAYWSTSGGATVQTTDSTNSNQEESSPVLSSPVEQPAMNTRRSLRQQAKKAAQTSYAEAEDDFVDVEGSDDEEFARFTPLPGTRKRFLKESHSGIKVGRRKQPEISETTAAVLNRLISKRPPTKPGYVVKAGRSNLPKLKAAGPNNARPPQSNQHTRVTAVAPPPMLRAPQHEMREMPSMLPLKVEIQEGNGTVVPGSPKKRGRKRKVDLPVNLSMKRDPDGEAPVQSQQQNNTQDPDWDPNAVNAQRKRGRQSAATAHVKNRFPFCSLCLSKDPPDDYIINYMSCPNEYQKMKRLFMYIYKDLRFPFMPFDLERENVFDYCDLPLCNCCIQLYREIFDSYAQIETARDQLKSKIERMVYQIQLSDQNPAVAQQLGAIKNSPDALMNKYCNFRRRFASYKPGDSRGEVEGAALVPATIARIRVINQVPKRTTGSQTFLTAGHFPPPTAKEDVTSPAPPTNVTTSKPTTSTASSSSGTVVIKKEVESEAPNKPSSSSASKPQKADEGNLVTAFKTSKEQLPQKQTPRSTPTQVLPTKTASPKVQVAVSKPSVPPPGNQVKPAAHSSVLTIIKTPGGGGPAIIRKLPPKPCIIGQPAKLLAIATPTHKLQGNKSANGPASTVKTPIAASSKSVAPVKPNNVVVTVKDEPVDVEDVLKPTEEEQDPFFNPVTETPSRESKSNKDGSTTDGEESKSQSDTNVFHKHKKLRVLPVPSYKDSSNDDSSDNNMAGNDGGSKNNVGNDSDGSKKDERKNGEDSKKDEGKGGEGSKEDEGKGSRGSKEDEKNDEMETQQPVLSTEESNESAEDLTCKKVPPQQDEK